VGRCRARHCPETDLDGERVLCALHWDLLPSSYRDWLADAYGTPRWKQVLVECLRRLVQIETAQREQPE